MNNTPGYWARTPRDQKVGIIASGFITAVFIVLILLG